MKLILALMLFVRVAGAQTMGGDDATWNWLDSLYRAGWRLDHRTGKMWQAKTIQPRGTNKATLYINNAPVKQYRTAPVKVWIDTTHTKLGLTNSVVMYARRGSHLWVDGIEHTDTLLVSQTDSLFINGKWRHNVIEGDTHLSSGIAVSNIDTVAVGQEKLERPSWIVPGTMVKERPSWIVPGTMIKADSSRRYSDDEHKIAEIRYERWVWTQNFLYQYSRFEKECWADSVAEKGFWFSDMYVGIGVDRIANANEKGAWWRKWDSLSELLEESYKTKAVIRWIHPNAAPPNPFVEFLRRMK